MNEHRGFLISALMLILSAVALGAFGAHGLENKLNAQQLATFETAVQYQMYHGLGLLMTSLMSKAFNKAYWKIGQWCLIFGVLGFSVSLYLYLATQLRFLVFITPLGGTAMILGWLWLIAGAWKGQDK